MYYNENELSIGKKSGTPFCPKNTGNLSGV